MQHIMLGTDGSETAHRAASVAADLAKSLGARVTVAHVMQPLRVPPESLVLPEYLEIAEKARQESGQRIVKGAASEIEHRLGRAPDVLLLDGNPAKELADALKTSSADLLVVGSRGLGAFSRILIGSTSSKLVHLCEKPVLVVP
jgi:nucleotide-binding universal stress UspA family protein